ncbi:hypothetical protein BH18ACI3_BH18ACI3_09080 [soil metagenome]
MEVIWKNNAKRVIIELNYCVNFSRCRGVKKGVDVHIFKFMAGKELFKS